MSKKKVTRRELLALQWWFRDRGGELVKACYEIAGWLELNDQKENIDLKDVLSQKHIKELNG